MYKIVIMCFVFLVCSFMQSYANTDAHFEKTLTELAAVKLFDQKKYKQAKKIEDLYPFSYWAMKAKLLSGISSYNMGDYGSAASNMDDYI